LSATVIAFERSDVYVERVEEPYTPLVVNAILAASRSESVVAVDISAPAGTRDR
jgi:hypothetical protein